MEAPMNIAPQQATLTETGELVNVEDVKPDTILAIKTGEVIGSCEVDEKTLIGYVSVKTSSLSEDCVISKMAKLVEEAQNNKPQFQRLIDRCAKYYKPAVVLISVVLALIPFVMRAHYLHHWLHLVLVVLVSAYALILSTPVATFSLFQRQ